jgi:hypothetical protein
MAEEKTLKQSNLIYVRGFIVLNIMIYWLIAGIDVKKFLDDFLELTINKIAEDVIGVSSISVLLYIFATTISGIISPEFKYILVFLKTKDTLPGCRAFSEYIHRDPRIDPKIIENKNGSLPTLPIEQNRLWYKIYKKYENERSVLESHKNFLLMRDLCSISLIFFLILGTIGYFTIANKIHWITYSSLLATVFLLLMLAAKNYGIRLVTNVLAVDTCSKPEK